ncbi:hypothetical protein [Bacillus cihuensis]|uniref:hypothetical protein n=1 Tax=Bacillus cihuensis TaxID=1208599 RepID=UPI00048AE1B2|nr:hypothetical protein [Bacillus cihuensis]
MNNIGERWYELRERIWCNYVVRYWNWFWYYRRGKIKFTVYDFGDHYNVSASNGKLSVHQCFGSTPEQAKEMAIWRLKTFDDRNKNRKAPIRIE